MVNRYIFLENLWKMFSIRKLKDLLEKLSISYEIIEHGVPLNTSEEAARYFEPSQIAPVLIVATEKGLMALIYNYTGGKIDFNTLKMNLNLSKCKPADKETIRNETGYRIGNIPIIDLPVTVIFDQILLKHPVIYGSTGNPRLILKIAPSDVIRLNKVRAVIDIPRMQD